MTFLIHTSTLVVDSPEDVATAARLNMSAVTYQELTNGRQRSTAGQQLMVISQQAPLEKVRELTARGVSLADVRYVELSPAEGTLSQMATYNVDRLRWMLANSFNVKSDRVRPLTQWPTKPDWEPVHINDEELSTFLRWRPRNLAFFVGDYGSGKSTLAQLLAIKMLTGATLWDRGGRISVCAWEDDRDDFEDRVMRFACGGDPNRFGVNLAEARKVCDRIFWFEPDEDPERLLDEYISNIEYLSLHENVRVHVADPWNSFSHLSDAESETKYVERMLTQLQQLTRKLDITIMVVTHLPKASTSTFSSIKPFRVGDAAGSKQWGNKADMGFCVVRTELLSAALAGEMDEDALKKLGLRPSHVEGANIAFPSIHPKEHMLVVTDKVKIEGMGPRQMGKKTVRAFCFDRERCDLVIDEAATDLAKIIWR